MCTPSVLSCLCNPIIFSTTSDPSFLFTSFRLSFNSVLESYWAIIASPSCHDQSISVQTHFSKAICHPWYLCTSHVFGSYAWECSLHHLSAHPLQDWRCPQMHFFVQLRLNSGDSDSRTLLCTGPHNLIITSEIAVQKCGDPLLPWPVPNKCWSLIAMYSTEESL